MAFFIPVDLFGNFADGWETGRKSVWDDRKQNEEVMAKRIENIHDADTLYGRIQDTNNKYFDNYLQYQVNERKQPGNLAMADVYNVGAIDARDVAYEPEQRRIGKQTIRANNNYGLQSARVATSALNWGGPGVATATAPVGAVAPASDKVATFNYPEANTEGGSMFSFSKPKTAPEVAPEVAPEATPNRPVGSHTMRELPQTPAQGPMPAPAINYAEYKQRETSGAVAPSVPEQRMNDPYTGMEHVEPVLLKNPTFPGGATNITLDFELPKGGWDKDGNPISYNEYDEEALYNEIPDEQLMMLAQSGQLAPGVYQFSDVARFGTGIQVTPDGSIFTV